MGKAAVNKSEVVVKIIPAKKGRWEIYQSGKQFGTRLLARNGKLICGNTGFNTVAGAVKNIKSIQASA